MAYVASTWQECWEIASDFQNFGGTTDPNTEHVFGQPCILSVDGDVHAGLRGMVGPNLRPRAVNRYIDRLVRPIAQRHLTERTPLQLDGVDSLIGRTAKVTREIDSSSGRIRLGADEWSARTQHSGESFAVGATVRILQVDGATAVVGDALE